MANVLTIIVVILILAAMGFYFYDRTQSLQTTTSTQSSSETSSQTSSTTQNALHNYLRRKFYINISSGEGIQWFGDSTAQDVRTGIYAWQYATKNLIQFNEVNSSNADIVVSFTSGISQNSTVKTIGETFVSEGLIKGTMQIIPQGVPCRNVGIMMHEVGHIIGLEHNQTNRFDIMYPLQSFGCDQNISAYDTTLAENMIEQLIS